MFSFTFYVAIFIGELFCVLCFGEAVRDGFGWEGQVSLERCGALVLYSSQILELPTSL